MGGRLPTDARSEQRARVIFAPLPRRYDLLAEVLSFGQNGRWRRRLVEHVAAGDPGTVCDVATGTAGVALALARRGRARVVGVDLSESMLSVGRERVARGGLAERVTLQLGTADHLPFDDASFDALSFTYLLRYVPEPVATLAELARVVTPGGTVAGLDFHVPHRAVWRRAWQAYTRLVLPVVGGLLGGRAWWRVGAFLGPNIEDHVRRHPLRRQLEAWHDAGIDVVAVEVMSLGGGVVIAGRVRDRSADGPIRTTEGS